MKLICYPYSNTPPLIRPAPSSRDWMDATPESFAYRCLPLTVANSYGWEILNPRGFSATWDGRTIKDGVHITRDAPTDPGAVGHMGAPSDAYVRPMAHFGSAVLTFELPMMFKTPPGWSLLVQPPVNRPKDGICGLTGVIETDWSPYTFTMNWMFTRADAAVRFDAEEPIAHIMPVRRSTLEKVEPEFRSIHEDDDRKTQNTLWRESRGAFLAGLDAKDAAAIAEKWQKAYYRGLRPDGASGAKDHQVKVRLRPFRPLDDGSGPTPGSNKAGPIKSGPTKSRPTKPRRPKRS